MDIFNCGNNFRKIRDILIYYLLLLFNVVFIDYFFMNEYRPLSASDENEVEMKNYAL